MYDVKHSQLEGVNFHRGHFPTIMGTGTAKPGVTIRKHSPVAEDDEGLLTEVSATTLNKLVGIVAHDTSGVDVVYYMTGDFFQDAIVLPEGVELSALKKQCRQLSIFLTA